MTADELRGVLRYCHDSGVFTWRVAVSTCVRAGAVAGAMDDAGYVVIRYHGKSYKAHRLAWLYVHGVWPEGVIDHRNRVKSDNRIDNRRDVDAVVNANNVERANAGSRSGLRGVSWFSQYGTWRANVQVAGHRRFLGDFDCKHAARAAYVAAKTEMLRTHQ